MPARTTRLKLALMMLGGAACALASQLSAQSATGKLEGRIQDDAGAPLPDAQVYLLGTAFGVQADARGHYFINNIPAGTYQIRAIFIGFEPVQVKGLRILADQTVTQDFTLTPAPLQLREIVVVAPQQLVPRDEVTTKQRIDGQFAEALPVDRLQDLLALQPGVVEAVSGALAGGRFGAEPGLSVRGGRPTENATYIDGVPVQPAYKGDRQFGFRDFGPQATSIEIGTNAVEEASVTTGSPSASYGNAAAGIIAIVTRTGGPEFQGSLGYETDEPFGVYHGPGLNRFEGAISGPLARHVTFALSGTLEGRQSVEEGFNSQNFPIFLSAGVDTTLHQASVVVDDTATAVDERLLADTTLVPVYNFAVARGRCDEFATAGAAGLGSADGAYIQRLRENFGFGCTGVRIPATARTLYTASAKLNYFYGTGSRLALSTAISRNQGSQFDFIIRHLNRLSLPATLRGFHRRSRLASLSWTQNLSRTPERALALEAVVSYQQDRTIGGPLTGESAEALRAPFGGLLLKPLHFLWDFETFPVDEHLIRNIRVNDGRIAPVACCSLPDPLDQLRNDAYGLYGKFGGFEGTLGGDKWQLAESGNFMLPNHVNLYSETRYVAKGTLDWQAGRYSRIKLGGEYTRHSIGYAAAPLRFPAVAYLGDPIRWNAFVEDRFDLGDVVVVGGLRYDVYDSHASRPYATDSAGHRYQFPRISTLPGFDPAHPAANFVRDRSHDHLSPRIQVAFPVTENTNFRFSYGHQVQAPDFGLLLSGVNIDLSVNSLGEVIGSDLDFGKTIAFEFGVRHAFSSDMVLDIAAYNKDIISDPATRQVRRYDPAKGRDETFYLLTNLDFGNVRGLDVRLDRRFGNWFNGTVAYAYQQAQSTGSDPFTYIYYGSFIPDPITGDVRPPPQGILPTINSRPHALTGAFALSVPEGWKRGSVAGRLLNSVSLFATFRYSSGTAYSRCGTGNDDQSVLSSENCLRAFPVGLNTERLPPYKELNTRIAKGFALGDVHATAYLDVRNLLNLRNVLQVFATNGSIRNDTERAANLRADRGDLADEGTINGVLAADSSLVLDFPHERCATWLSNLSNGRGFTPAAANCMYLIRAEQRYGDGDGVFTVAEQSRAINALYDLVRGEQAQTAPGRRARLGVEISF